MRFCDLLEVTIGAIVEDQVDDRHRLEVAHFSGRLGRPKTLDDEVFSSKITGINRGKKACVAVFPRLQNDAFRFLDHDKKFFGVANTVGAIFIARSSKSFSSS